VWAVIVVDADKPELADGQPPPYNLCPFNSPPPPGMRWRLNYSQLCNLSALGTRSAGCIRSRLPRDGGFALPQAAMVLVVHQCQQAAGRRPPPKNSML